MTHKIAGQRFLAPLLVIATLAALFAGVPFRTQPAYALSGDVVISQVYGGGGNTGATYKNDFIELFNRGATTVNVSTWSVQYASATGTTWQLTNLSGSIAPGKYYLVQEAVGTGGTTNLPTPDATGTLALSGTAGKVALVTSQTALACGASCASASGVKDFVGFGTTANNYEGTGPAPAPSNTTADIRGGAGCVETDNNSTDFVTGAPTPRNSASPANPCGGTATSVPTNTATTGATNTPGGVTSTPTNTAVATNTAAATNTATATNTVVAGSVRIRDIQGASHISSRNGQNVTNVPGIVTAKRSAGFYLQDPSPDASNATSEGIYVFGSNSVSQVAVGDSVLVSGTVSEYRATTQCDANGLTLTEISFPTVTVLTHDNTVPSPILIGAGGRIPPTAVIDDDATGNVETSGTFDADTDGIDFWESLEGMLVQINNPVATGPTSLFSGNNEIPVVGDYATQRTAEDGVYVSATDFNPERIILNDYITRFTNGAVLPSVNVGDHFTTSVVGAVDYAFCNFKLQNLTPLTRVADGAEREMSVNPGANQLSIGSFNVENLGGTEGQAKFDALASLIVNNLKSPDIIALEEIQDNNGETNDSVVDASTTLNRLISAIQTAGGPTYQFRQINPVDDQDGGAPGGNIRVGFIYRTDRGVAFVDRAGGTSTAAVTVNNVGGEPQLSFSPGRVDPTNSAWNASRKPLVGEFTYNGQTVFVVAVHFNSKGGDEPLFGFNQPPTRSSEVQRHQQATILNNFLDQIVAIDPSANIVVAGDLNDFQFSDTLNILKGGSSPILVDLIETLPANEQYTYVYEGNSQALDHILASTSLASNLALYDVVHVNAEFYDQISDHDPEVSHFNLPGPGTATVVATNTAVATATSTATQTATAVATSTETATAVATSTETATTVATSTETATAVNTAIATSTASNTSTAIATSTVTTVASSTASATVPSSTNTATASATVAGNTATATATSSIPSESVVWINKVGVSDSGSTLTRISVPAGWDAGAVSSRQIAPGDGYVQATIASTSTYLMLGLSNGDTDQNYTDIDFAIYTYASTGQLAVYENGVYRGNGPAYTTGDVIKVAVEGGVVKYSINGTVFYTSSTAPTYPLLFDTSIYTPGGQIQNAVIAGNNLTNVTPASATSTATATSTTVPLPVSAVTWINQTNVTASGNTITKTSGANAWDAGAVSSMQIASGDGYVQATVADTTRYVMFGLGNGDTSASYTDIEYAIYTYANTGQLAVYESGTYRGNGPAYAAGDVLKVSVEGGVVKYSQNGTVFYTSSVAPSYPLLLDSSIASLGGQVSNAFIAGNNLTAVTPAPATATATATSTAVPQTCAPVVYSNPVNVNVTGNNITKSAGGDAWNAGAISSQIINSGDGSVSATVADTFSYTMVGLGTGNNNGNYTGIRYAIYTYASTGQLAIYENGAYKGSGPGYTTGDVIKVAVEGGVVKYSRNGTVFYSSSIAPTYPLRLNAAIFTLGASVNNAQFCAVDFSSAAVVAGRNVPASSMPDAPTSVGAAPAQPVVSGAILPPAEPVVPTGTNWGAPAEPVVPVAGTTFSDVPSDFWAAQAIQWASANLPLSGYSLPNGGREFRPYQTATRGQVVKLLVVAAGYEVASSGTQSFNDVETNSPFYAYIETAVAHNLITGYADGSFRANNPLTRAQMAKLVALAAGWTLTPAGSTFTDVASSDWAASYIATVAAHGVVTGYADGSFKPNAPITRAQMTKMLYNGFAGN